MGKGKVVDKSPLMLALMDKRVKAEVVDFDHYRIRGGMAVETDYIIRVEPIGNPKGKDPQFESFTLSKTFSAFRTLGHQLKKASDDISDTGDNIPASVEKLLRYCETVLALVETQRTEYLGKVNYNYVKVLAQKRSQILKETLEATLNYFPDEIDSHSFHADVATTIETFFLTDHCVEADDQNTSKSDKINRQTGKKYSSKDLSGEKEPEPRKRHIPFQLEPLDIVVGNVGKAVDEVGTFLISQLTGTDEKDKTPQSTTRDGSMVSPVVPYTRKNRRSIVVRSLEDNELKSVGEEATLLLDDERAPTELVPSYSRPLPNFSSQGSKLGDILENNPMIFALIALVAVRFLSFAGKLNVTMDLDIMLLLIWAAFCIGLHTPRPMIGGIDKSAGAPLPSTPTNRRMELRKQDHQGRRLLRMSMATPSPSAQAANRVSAMLMEELREEEDELMDLGQSPLPKFPDGAPLGSKLNCWSEPDPINFHVRGAKYLTDKVKVTSGPFLFPVRAVDLFLTDACPENAGSNSGVLGGNLRDLPTFIINFRLPWGVLLAYFEIPERFLPFVRAGHEEGFDKSNLPFMDGMPPGDRCVARFLQGSVEHKNETLKIVPMVVEGPWVVKSVVGGKPAIIGTKLPVNYFYQKPEEGKSLYLEADLDIVASSAARGILSVTRTYTQVLTLDLGFVVQGNSADELPEQMLIGARLHGIDPMTAPPYPPSKDMFVGTLNEDEADD